MDNLSGPSTKRAIVQTVPLLEELLDLHAEEIGSDFRGYRGHCYRVLNFCVALRPEVGQAIERLAIATAFHDIGIWTNRTFDYLDPSIRVAVEYLEQTGKEPWIEETSLAIREHHRVTSSCGRGGFVEPFRRADWIDVSGGLLTFGLPRGLIREAFAIWPSAGFHRKLMHLSWERFKTNPLSPLPMLRL